MSISSSLLTLNPLQSASIDLSDKSTNCILKNHHNGSISARDASNDFKIRKDFNDLIKDKAIL